MDGMVNVHGSVFGRKSGIFSADTWRAPSPAAGAEVTIRTVIRE